MKLIFIDYTNTQTDIILIVINNIAIISNNKMWGFESSFISKSNLSL